MKKILIIITVLFYFSCSFAQKFKCGTDHMVEKELLLNPNKRLILNQLEVFTQNFLNNSQNARMLDSNYIIPVVVHVIHDYGEERIDTEQVQSAIKSMCEDFSLSNDDLINTDGSFIAIDSVYIICPDLKDEDMQLQWSVDDGSSIKRTEELCVLFNGIISSPITIDNYGNNSFSGGVVKFIMTENSNITSGDTIAKIITTQARGFEEIAGNVGVEFRLATIDPDGNCTTGINYNQSRLTFIGGENVKDDTYWDNSMYLNIWTVASVASGAAAYAYYPGSAPTNHEGILCQHDYFGTSGTSSSSNWRRHTIAHEAGHYLNLAHPWGSTNDPGLEENCGMDDGVDDTPNSIGSSGCSTWTSQMSCESIDNVANIMDYTNCAYMFTLGQKQRIIAALNSSSGYRNNLWTSQNLELTGTNDTHFFANPHESCKPIADFKVIGDVVGALGSNSDGFEVSFESMSYNAPESEMSYEWFFPGALPEYSSEKNPTVSYIQSGQHSVRLIVSNESGESSLTKDGCIVILDQTSSPFQEGFESLSFPISDSEDKPSWYIVNNYPEEENWEKTSTGFYEGSQSIRIRSKSFSAYANNIIQQLYTPEINCSDATHTNENPFGIYFKVAYAKRLPYLNQNETSIIPDQLTVSRKHANQDFMVRATYDVDDLVSNYNTHFNTFVPETNDWQQKFVNLGSSAGRESLIVKFEFSGKGYLSSDTVIFTNNGGEYISNNVGGNWLYIDDVWIGNLEEQRVHSPLESISSNNKIYDLYGREYFDIHKLQRGVYIQNNNLVFIK